MNTVYVLVALVVAGNWMPNTIVPTLEFKTLEKCQAAITAFERDSDNKKGSSARMRCVRIEK